MSALAFGVRESRGLFGLKGPRAADWLSAHGIAVPAAPNTWIVCGVPDGQRAAVSADVAGDAPGVPDREVATAAGNAGDREVNAVADAQGVREPAPCADAALLVARLGASEFFLEDDAGSGWLRDRMPAGESYPPGVYPVLRQDWTFLLSGDRAEDVLAQVCNVNFRDLAPASRPVIMTLMIGVAVLVVPHGAAMGGGRAGSAVGSTGARGDAGTGTAADAPGEPRYRFWCDPTFGPYLDAALGEIVIECGGHHAGVSA